MMAVGVGARVLGALLGAGGELFSRQAQAPEHVTPGAGAVVNPVGSSVAFARFVQRQAHVLPQENLRHPFSVVRHLVRASGVAGLRDELAGFLGPIVETMHAIRADTRNTAAVLRTLWAGEWLNIGILKSRE
jgi:hypothetical protein